MIIILEGPDCSGKSTLAKQLSRQCGFTIVHMTKPTNDKEKQEMMGEYIKLVQSKKNIILDRCWYSEMVYGGVMRNESVIDCSQMYQLERSLAKNGAIIIYCTGSPNVMWERCTQRGETYITSKEKYTAICDGYENLMGMPHYIPVTRYVFTEV